jgi:DNA replication protein DnaC
MRRTPMARRAHRPPTPDPHQELLDLALDLDLTALAGELLRILAAAEQQQSSFLDFSLAMLRTEAMARRERSLQRILKCARLGAVEGLEGFDFTIRPMLDPRIVKGLMSCRFVEEHRNVLCLGKPGTGKTRVMKAIGHAACGLGITVLYVLFSEMLETLHAARADRTYLRTFRRFVKPQLLIIDEWAYDPVGVEATNDLFRLVSARYRQGSMILAANTGFAKWAKLFPAEASAVATVDRLVHDATILRFTGKGGRQPREISGAPLDEE